MTKMFWRRLLIGLSLALNVVLLYRLVWSDQGMVAYKTLKQQSTAMEARLKDLDTRNLALSREIRLLQADGKYVEKMIRKRLNFVKDNEILYIFPETQAEAATPGAGSDEGKN